MLCLDTNVAIAVMDKSSSTVMERFARARMREVIYFSPIVLYELEFGIAASSRRIENEAKLNLFLSFSVEMLPFDRADAREAADIRADLKRKGTPIGPYDVLIAAQGRCRGATLVTTNVREFARVSALRSRTGRSRPRYRRASAVA